MEQARQLAGECPDEAKYRRHIATNARVLADLAWNRRDFDQSYQFAKAATEEYCASLSASPDELAFIRDAVITATVAARAAFESAKIADARALSELACRTIREALLRNKRELKRWHLLVFALRQQLDLELIPESARLEHLAAYKRELEFAHRTWPEDALLKISLAQVYILLDRTGDAREFVRDISIVDVRPHTLGILGLVYLKTGDVESAERCFSRLGDYRMAPAYESLILAHHGKHAEAFKLMDSMHDVRHLPSYTRIRQELERLCTMPREESQ